VELIPKAVIAGLFQGQMVSTGTVNMLLQPPGAPKETINRIWSDVVKDYPYQSLQFEASGNGGAFVGEGGPEDVVIIQPPLIQVRALLKTSAQDVPQDVPSVANKIASIIKTTLHHLGGPPPLNLGVKIIYHAPAPGQVAAEFLRTEMIKGDEDLRALAGSVDYEASLKVLLKGTDTTYTLLIEPFQADPTYLFIDLDAQFPGAVDVGRIEENVLSVDNFVTKQVRNFLDRRAEEWSK
jgi:hypothetical protein